MHIMRAWLRTSSVTNLPHVPITWAPIRNPPQTLPVIPLRIQTAARIAARRAAVSARACTYRLPPRQRPLAHIA